MTDSAGVPWEGRRFHPNAAADDDGSAPDRLIEAIRRFHNDELGEADVVDAVREARLLVPLVAHLGDAQGDAHRQTELKGDHGLVVDKSQELSIVTVAGPDGRSVMLAFTSVEAMAQWNPEARPIPAAATRVALAAAGDGTDVIIIDATTVDTFVVRRPALWAIAQAKPWIPSYLDKDVLREFMVAAEREEAVIAVQLAPGDPDATLMGPELVAHLTLMPGLHRDELDAIVTRLRVRWASSEIIATRVDSLRVELAASERPR